MRNVSLKAELMYIVYVPTPSLSLFYTCPTLKMFFLHCDWATVPSTVTSDIGYQSETSVFYKLPEVRWGYLVVEVGQSSYADCVFKVHIHTSEEHVHVTRSWQPRCDETVLQTVPTSDGRTFVTEKMHRMKGIHFIVVLSVQEEIP